MVKTRNDTTMTTRRSFLKKACLSGVCLCGFSSILRSETLAAFELPQSGISNKNEAMFLKWITGLLKNLDSSHLTETHAGHDWLINVDLKDFFHTIKLDSVNNYFRSLGYEEEVVKTLTALCTYKSRLPQGAPTSPMLSNIIASKMDEMMLEYCKKRGIIYTRYADDLTFSADSDVKVPPIEDIYKIVYLNGFKVNRMKTKVRYKGCKQEVTGLTVTNGVHVSQKYKKEILRELHFCKKFGVYEHYQHLKTTKGLYKDWLRGKIMFVRQIDPACGNKMLEQFNELNWLV